MTIAPQTRLESARSDLDEVDRATYLGNLAWAAVNAYSAMTWVAGALLGSRRLSFEKDVALHTAFGREFVKTGELDPKYHRWILDAFRLQAAPSTLAIGFDEKVIETMAERAEEFLEVGERYLEWVREGEGGE